MRRFSDPVIAVYSYEKMDEAIELANSLPYSFQASVFTKNIDTALESVKKLKAASVLVNDHTAFRVDWMPFRGAGHSGIGTGGYSVHDARDDPRKTYGNKVIRGIKGFWGKKFLPG